MSSQTTHITSVEFTCDICGRKESWTAIEGITQEGTAVSANWVTFAVSVPAHGVGPGWSDVCSKECYMTQCERRYDELRT